MIIKNKWSDRCARRTRKKSPIGVPAAVASRQSRLSGIFIYKYSSCRMVVSLLGM